MAVTNVCNIEVSFTVVWLDKDIEKTNENQDTKALLRRKVSGHLATFDNADECVNYIITTHKKRVFLIVSSAFGVNVISLIYQLPQIVSIYVFCLDRNRAEEWAKPQMKITGVFTEKNSLISKIDDDLRACDKDSRLSMSIFHLEDTQCSLRDLNKECTIFMWHQLLLVVLQHLGKSADSKAEMIRECRSLYQIDPIEQSKINKFDQEYTTSKAIWWYTYDCFAYRLLNKALRTQNIDIIFKFRFFIHDLNNQIRQLYVQYLEKHRPLSEHRIQVYRGQHLHVDELNLLRNNVNGLISMNTFLSATFNMTLALIFAEIDQNCPETTSMRSVLLIIDVHDMSSKTTPFAPIKSYSCYQEEDEVLFTIGAIFKVKTVTQVNQTWHVHLQLSREENQLRQNLSRHIMDKIGQDASPLTLGWFLFRMNDFNKAERYAQSLLEQLPADAVESGKTYNLLGLIYKDTGRLDKAVQSYEKSLLIFNSTSSPDSPHVMITHYNLGLAYLALGNKQLADEHQKKADSKLINSTQASNPLLISMTDSLKAKVDAAHGNYSSALETLRDVLKMKQNELPLGHPSIASTLKDIGIIQMELGDDHKAWNSFEAALDIYRKILTPNHLDFADCYFNMARIHYKRQEYPRALKKYEKALNIIQNATREDFTNVEALKQCITVTKQMMT